MEKSFLSLITDLNESGQYTTTLQRKDFELLPASEVLIKVFYSSVNYKDALSATGNKGVTKNYPHTPGIDISGIVEESTCSLWKSGDQVIVTGFDLGMNTSGGFAEYVRVPSNWIIRLPNSLSLRDAMIFGTADLTAGLSVLRLIENGLKPELGPIAVSGSTGGVGSLSISILNKLGFHVIAISSKKDAEEYLRKLGAKSIILRTEMEDESGKILLKPRFAGAIDTVGGKVLATLLKSLQYGGLVTACGMVNGGELNTTVFPFILKGIKLMGIDSVEIPIDQRLSVWEKLGNEWKPDDLNDLVNEISLDQVPTVIEQMLSSNISGRYIIKIFKGINT